MRREGDVDSSSYLLKYEPLEYINSLPLVRKNIVHDSKPDINGRLPIIVLPNDEGLHLLRTLLMLDSFFILIHVASLELQ